MKFPSKLTVLFSGMFLVIGGVTYYSEHRVVCSGVAIQIASADLIFAGATLMPGFVQMWHAASITGEWVAAVMNGEGRG
jgi:hypothetical protein